MSDDLNRHDGYNTNGGRTQAVDFLQWLKPPPWILIAIPLDGPIVAHSATTPEEVQKFIGAHDGKDNLYYTVNSTAAMNKKPKKEDITSVEYLLGDLDSADNETAEDAKARYLNQLNGSFEPKPSATIDSGNGIQCLWKLSTSIQLGKDREATVADVEARSKALMERLGSKAGTQNIDRIMRLPGTTNIPTTAKLKRGRVPCPTRALAFNGSSYPLDAFATPHVDDDHPQQEKEHKQKQEDHPEDKLQRIIRLGENGEFKGNRSDAVWFVVQEMLRRGYPQDIIIPTILYSKNKISEHVREQKDPAEYALRQVIKAKAELGERPPPIISNVADDVEPSPREWLLGNIFCREFLSSLFGDGGVGKTALRYAQYMSLALGRSLTGEHVFQRCRVLIISLEDGDKELRRRLWALRRHYDIKPQDLDGWLFRWSPRGDDSRLITVDRRGNLRPGPLRDHLEYLIKKHKLDLIGIDPFVKTHGVGENDNTLIDKVAQILTDICHEYNIAADVPHHVNKQNKDTEPGDANRGRGASALKDAARLVYTLNAMTKEEAKQFSIKEEDRPAYVRMDKGKVNIAPPSRQAKWFRLIGVPIGNATERYPHGDEVQVVEPWDPPAIMRGINEAEMDEILARIDKGLDDGSRYTDGHSATTRAAWKVVVEVVPGVGEAQAREVIKKWVANKVLVSKPYRNAKTRKEEVGLWKEELEIPF
jgi:hypothetical protein